MAAESTAAAGNQPLLASVEVPPSQQLLVPHAVQQPPVLHAAQRLPVLPAVQ